MPPQLGGLGLDFFDVVAEELGDLGNGPARLELQIKVAKVHRGPGLAAVDSGHVGWGLLTQVQHIMTLFDKANWSLKHPAVNEG
jgi:hypothetical protein